MKNKKLWAAIASVLLVVVVAAVWLLYRPERRVAPPKTSAPTVASVQITEDGFVPQTLKIKVGTQVTWTNVDIAPHRVAANPFPSHSDLPALDSKTNVAANGTYSFTFDKTGSFGYHDELNPKTNGTIIVE